MMNKDNINRGVKEGFFKVNGYRSWYRVTGDLQSSKTPLLLLHGGPGAPSDTLKPFEALSGIRPIIRYDQLGCGRSDRPGNPTLWKIETFTNEIDLLRQELGLRKIHLLGVSWGGMLALEYLFTNPIGVESLILSSSLCNVQFWAEENRRLINELPKSMQDIIYRYQKSFKPIEPLITKDELGFTQKEIEKKARSIAFVLDLLTSNFAKAIAPFISRLPFLKSLAYFIASLEFNKRHVCRLKKIPNDVFEMFAGMNDTVYNTMWGPSEFFPTGNLSNWNVEDRLDEIKIPTLITSGYYDEATPAHMKKIHNGIKSSRWVCFKNSSHMAMYEESELYFKVISEFLNEI